MLDNENIKIENVQERVFKPKRDNFLEFYKRNSFLRLAIKVLIIVGICLTAFALLKYPDITMFQKYYIYFSCLVALVFGVALYINSSNVPKNSNTRLIENEPQNKYMLTLGLKVKKFYGNAKKSTFQNNIVKQLLYNAEKFKRHMMILATIGGGKTFLMKGLAEQQIILGGGFVVVDGKGTAEFAKEMFGLSNLYGRGREFIHLNFLDQENSHSINPLQSGSVNAIYEILIALLIGEENEWKAKQKEFMKNILKLAIYKRDYEKLDLNFTVLSEYMTLTRLVNEALLYKEIAKKDSNVRDFVNFVSSSIGIDLNEFLYSQFEVDYNVDRKIYPQGQIAKQKNDFLEKVRKNETNRDFQGVYDASMSASAWRGVLTTLGSDYKNILNAKEPTTTLWEVIQHNKLLFVTLPTMDSDQTPKELGRLMLGLLKSVAQDKAKKAVQPEIPFLAMFDELGSYIINGYGRLKSKCRSLGIAVVSIFQSFSQIDQVDEGKGLETKEMLDVTGTLVIMKVVNPDVTEYINKKLPQTRFIDRSYQEKNHNVKGQVSADVNYQVLQEDVIKHHEVESMNDGEMLVITDGEIHKAVANTELNFRKYGKVVTFEGNKIDKGLPLTQYMKRDDLFKQLDEKVNLWKRDSNGLAVS